MTTFFNIIDGNQVNILKWAFYLLVQLELGFNFSICNNLR